MVKRRRYSTRPISEAAAAAHDARIAESMDMATARGSFASQQKYGLSYALADSKQKYNRYLAGFKGRGDYKSALAWGSRGLGGAVGGYFGGARGAATGYGWGSRFSKWMGWGKYKRRRKNYRGRGDYAGDAGGNQIMGGSVDTPLTVNASDDLSGDVYISHREFLGNVTALANGTSTPSAFNLVQYPLNVGLTASFPWLSQIAQNFTMYELIGCIFEYKPTSGELGSLSNALGKIVMATQYDPDAPQFLSSVEMENYDYSNACKPSESMLHGIETSNQQRATNMMYIRTGPSSKSRLFTDYGLFQIATEGLPTNATAGTIINVGELWVTYRVKLSRAQLHGSLLGANISTDILEAWSNGSSSITANTTAQLQASVYAGAFNPQTSVNAFVAKKTNSIGCIALSTALDTARVSFPANIVSGLYQVDCYMLVPAAGPAIRWVAPANLTFCTLVDYPASGGGASILRGPDVASTTTTVATMSFWIKVVAPGTNVARFDVSVNGATSANTQYVIQITEANSLAHGF